MAEFDNFDSFEQPVPKDKVNSHILSTVAICAISLFIAYCGYKCDESEKKAPEIAAPPQEQTVDKPTALEQWKQLEREQRDSLYEQLITQTGEDSLIAVLEHMPTTLSFLDKWHPSRRLDVGPRQYIFEDRPVRHRTRDAPLSVRPDSASLHSSLWGIETPWHTYHTVVENAMWDLGLPRPHYVDQSIEIPMAPFYESVRNPTTQDLKKLYRFVHNYVPSFIAEAFYEPAVKSEIAKAREMIAADPIVYGPTYTYYPKKHGYWNPIADPAKAEFVVQPTRYENGELQFPEVNGSPIVRLGLVFPEQWEKQSAFTKWLYRRGPQFIDNFEIMLDAYASSANGDEFVTQVMQGLSL